MDDKSPYTCLQKKKGRYHVVIYYYDGEKRKTKNRATGILVDAPSKRKVDQQRREAEHIAEKILHEFLTENDPSDEKFVTTAETWLRRQEGKKAPSTLASYTYIVQDICLYFGQIKPIRTVDMTSVDVEDYIAWERRRRQPGYDGKYAVQPKFSDGSGIENTIKHRATAVRSILQSAKRSGLVSRNVASSRDSDVDLPKIQHHTFEVLTLGEAGQMVKALDGEETWFRVAVLLGLVCGLRRSEIVGLQVDDIDFQNDTIVIRHVVTQQTLNGKNVVSIKPRTKNNTPRTLRISLELRPYIELLLKENQKYEREFDKFYDQTWRGHIMRYPDGKLISPNALTNRYNRFLKQHGIKKIRFHDLRHSCASLMVANGESIQTIQEVLGHTQATTTMLYTHQFGFEKDNAVNSISSCIFGRKAESEKKEQIDGTSDGTTRKS